MLVRRIVAEVARQSCYGSSRCTVRVSIRGLVMFISGPVIWVLIVGVLGSRSLDSPFLPYYLIRFSWLQCLGALQRVAATAGEHLFKP